MVQTPKQDIIINWEIGTIIMLIVVTLLLIWLFLIRHQILGPYSLKGIICSIKLMLNMQGLLTIAIMITPLNPAASSWVLNTASNTALLL